MHSRSKFGTIHRAASWELHEWWESRKRSERLTRGEQFHPNRTDSVPADLVREMGETFDGDGAGDGAGDGQPQRNEPSPATHMLLLLRYDTFHAGERANQLAEQVRAAMACNFPILLVHDVLSCSFDHFFVTTPLDLISAGLYKMVAIPLLPGVHEPVSMRLVLKTAMSANEEQSLHLIAPIVRRRRLLSSTFSSNLTLSLTSKGSSWV